MEEQATKTNQEKVFMRRNANDELRVKISVRIIAAENTMSAMVKLATEIGESTFEVIGCGIASQTRNKWWKAMLHFFLGQLIARCKFMAPSKRKVDYMRSRSAAKSSVHEQCPCKRSNSENHLPIRQG